MLEKIKMEGDLSKDIRVSGSSTLHYLTRGSIKYDYYVTRNIFMFWVY